jgi:hypothetical protein
MEKSAILKNFYEWMKFHSTLSDSTLEKYSRAVNTVSKDMLSIGVIKKSLLDMSLAELDYAVAVILHNKEFIAKNSRGNNMYSCGLKQFRYYILDTVDEIDTKTAEIIETIKTDPNITQTERQSLIKSRIGQGNFRKSLIEKYDGKCVITGIDIGKVLIASHIIPWSVSDNTNRLSVDNGVLLSATYDRLFDCGLITFKSNGELISSRFIQEHNKRKLGLNNTLQVNLKASTQMLRNLEYHRDVIFLK